MGNYLQSDENWYVYKRVLSTDEWVSEPVQSWTGTELKDALSQFKHEAYSFALKRHTDYKDTKCIYLYHGNNRIAKARVHPETEQLEIWSANIREWLQCPEMLAAKRYPELKNTFEKKYVTEHAWVNTQTIIFVCREQKTSTK